ncbi:lipocalin family protein [Polaribacter sp. MSW13]|uniref:Lipocalin family protein n=1 Tax=Polaribacter marinus TaxID=2916838 RepID=A0A9X1VT17_9FLAO|nr:lipocalin family protein [Polaribacter marinus]MCI2230290.1 lipocalin family protein [Polaribacter marinus]
MKKTLTFLLLAFIMFGCSSNDDLENSTNLILGKWTLEAKFFDSGANKDIVECEKKSDITFSMNTYNFNNFRINTNGECGPYEKGGNLEYNLKGDILEIKNYKDELREVKILFINNNTFELYEKNQNGNFNNNKSEIWKRNN